MLTKDPDFKALEAEYDHLFKTDPIRDETHAYAWFAKQIIKEKPTIRQFLDIACGGGFFLNQILPLLDKNALVYGVDISTEALHIATKECPKAQLIQCAAEHQPFLKHSFDVITCLGSLEHFLDIPGAIQEMKRIAAPQARIFILVPNIFWYKDILAVLLSGNRINRNQIYERFASQMEWIQLIEQSGLRVLKTLKYNGIARKSWKQRIKDFLIPTRFSYHFLFVCTHQ